MMEEWSAPEAPADQNAAGDIWRVLIHNDDRTPFRVCDPDVGVCVYAF